MPSRSGSWSVSSPRRVGLRVALIYAAFGVIWILSSDQILHAVAPDLPTLTRMQTIKGWAFIAVTAAVVYLLVYRHVAALHRSHELLSRSEQRYRTIVETSHDGIAVTDGKGRLVLVNSRMVELLGRTEHDLLGQPLSSFLNGPGVATIQEAVRQGETAEPCPVDARIIRPDGSQRWAVGSLCPFSAGEGEQAGILAMFTDITERKWLEDELHQSQKMEAVGQLAGGVAHDFNNLLTAIFGYADLARDTLAADHPALTSLAGVTAAAEQAAGVTKALLTFSRKTHAVKQPVNLNTVVDKAARLLKRVLPAGIELTTDLAPDEIMVRADNTQLQQIIMNLAINARDAMPAGGTLRISTRRQKEITQNTPPTAQPGWGILIVEDTGRGMSPQVQRRIFEPFFTTKPKGVGTGLGLSIIHGIVKDHTGDIQVQSEPDQGTVFTITLPPAECLSLDSDAEPEQPARGNGELILLAEDNVQVRDLTTAALTGYGYRVQAVGDGEALLETFEAEQHKVRLILTDLQMPKRDGLACLENLRARGVTVPAILITGSIETGAEEVLDAHTTLVRKPFQFNALANLIGKCLAKAPEMM